MPKYRIHCYETRSRWLDVEAPNKEAALRFYGTTDGSEYHGDGDQLDWGFDEIEEMQGNPHPVDFTVSEDGEVCGQET